MASGTDLALPKGEIVWGKAETKTAQLIKWAIIGAAGIAAFWFWGLIVPFVLTTVADSFLASLYAGGLFLLFVIASNKRVHRLGSYIGRSIFRAIAGFFVEVDPIGILKSHAEDAEKNLGIMDGHIKRLNGEINATQKIVDTNDNEARRNLSILKQAKSGDKTDLNRETAILSSRQAGRLEQSNVTLKDLLKRMRALYTILTKLRSHVNVMVQDMRAEIVVKEREYNAINKAYGAFTAALKVLRGDASSRELYEMAMQHLDDNYATKVGAIEDFMKSSAGFLNGLDLQNGMFEEQALTMLADMEKKSALLLGDGAALEGVYTDPDQSSQDDLAALFAKR